MIGSKIDGHLSKDDCRRPAPGLAWSSSTFTASVDEDADERNGHSSDVRHKRDHLRARELASRCFDDRSRGAVSGLVGTHKWKSGCVKMSIRALSSIWKDPTHPIRSCESKYPDTGGLRRKGGR